jgi:hypothetical protein
MADPRVFDTPVGVARAEALDALIRLLADVPEAQETFAERYGNDYLRHHSSATLVVAARDDRLVRAEHGQVIMLQALAHVLTAQDRHIADQDRRISELESTATTGSTKR